MQILQFLNSNHKRAGLICSLICITAGVIPLAIFTFFADPAHPYSITPVILTSADGTQIEALVYSPLSVTGNRPGIVVGHGFTGNKRYMQPLSIELVKRGWMVVSIDFRGHGSSGGELEVNRLDDPGLEEDMTAAMNYLISLGTIDKIGLVGHSMGGRTALHVAEQNYGWINATVSIGMVSTDFNFTRIPNLLMAVGQFDQLFSEATELNFLKNYTSLSEVAVNTPYGNFGAGTACKVAIAPLIEHLFEPLNPVIMEEMVKWFEQAFNGSIPSDVMITATFNTAAFMIAMAGMCSLVFIALVYLSNAMFKRGLARPEREIVQDVTGRKLVILAILAYGIGAAFLFPLSDIFPTALPVAMGNMLLAVLVGNAIGLLVIYYLLVLRREEKRQIAEMFGKMKGMCAHSPGRSFCFGILSALLTTSAITAIMEWSSTTTILTAREFGSVFSIALVFFPFLFVKEFYFRAIQGRLGPTNRVKEYLKMAGVGCFIDNVLLVPLMLVLWQNADREVAFLALAIFVFIAFSIIQQLLVTWVYMHSGRNILGSTIFYCIFYGWMIVNFFPFGFN